MKKVLVVDDSKTVLSLIEHELHGYENIECLYAQNYKDAVAIVRKHHKDLKVALLDINLPDAPNGEIVHLANANNIPTIVLTGTLSQKTRETIQKREIVSYILKDKTSSIKLAAKNVLRTLENYDTTIMVVDDSSTYRKALSQVLKKNHFNVLEAENGQEALDIFNNFKEKISIVITDYEMPLVNGLDLTIKLREIYEKNRLGILAISNMNNISIINDFLTFGADDFINKPFTPSEIMARINSSLEILNLFKQITDMANKDFMTGAYNRRYFFESGRNIFLKSKRKNLPLAVAMLDIDKFKKINDTYGHNIGDIAIKEVKKILCGRLRNSDLMARFGGEEFCILLDDISFQDTQKLFENIRDSFEKNIINILDVQISYTVSIGVCYGVYDSLEEMIKLSDEALYSSKNNGRNQVTMKAKEIN